MTEPMPPLRQSCASTPLRLLARGWSDNSRFAPPGAEPRCVPGGLQEAAKPAPSAPAPAPACPTVRLDLPRCRPARCWRKDCPALRCHGCCCDCFLVMVAVRDRDQFSWFGSLVLEFRLQFKYRRHVKKL